MRNRALGLGVLALIIGCDVVDPEISTELGAIFLANAPVRVVIPDEAVRGQPFTVDLDTYGDGCVSFSRTEIEIDADDRVVEIRPYNRHDTRDACADVLRTIPHRATLAFGTPGTITVRVIGTRLPAVAEDTITKLVLIR